MRRGELRVNACRRHEKFHCTKSQVANSMLWPCGLGCQLLGPCHSICLGTNLVYNHLLWVRLYQNPVPLPRRTVEDDSPKPSCNKWRPWQRLRRTWVHQDVVGWSRLGKDMEADWGSGQGCQVCHGAADSTQFYQGTTGRAPILVQCNGKGLRQTSRATYAMLFWLVDNTWTSLGATDAPKSTGKKFRASWMNSYQELRAEDPGSLGQG